MQALASDYVVVAQRVLFVALIWGQARAEIQTAG
jgi:hypothetical protein